MPKPRKSRPPIDLADAPKGMRQRQRANGSWRVWWEPDVEARQMGFQPADLDSDRPSWSISRAKQINRDVIETARRTGAAQKPQGRTMRDLIENYQRSPNWAELAEKTRASYARLLSQIEAKWGMEPVVSFTKPVMAEWYETVLMSGKPRMAQALIRMASILFSRAEIIGWRPEGMNPCFRLKMRTPDPRQRSISWPDLDALVNRADGLGLPGIGTAVLMLALQGQRSTDVRKAKLSAFQLVMLDPGAAPVWVWRVTRQKRGNLGVMQLHPEVETRLRPRLLRAVGTDDAPACPRADTGGHYTEDLLIKHFNKVRDATKRKTLVGIQMRDLRRTFGVLARQAGASREDVGDALGNTAAHDPRLYETYMPATAKTASRAVNAIRRPTPPLSGQ